MTSYLIANTGESTDDQIYPFVLLFIDNFFDHIQHI